MLLDYDKSDFVEIDDTQFFSLDLKALANPTPLQKDDLGERCFSLLGGRVIFGLLVGELPDSFLVSLASTLVNIDDVVVGKLLTSSSTIRLFKNGIAFMSMPETEHRYYYYRHILRLIDTMPDFFNQERLAKINSVIALGYGGGVQKNRPHSPTDSVDEDDSEVEYISPYYSSTRH